MENLKKLLRRYVWRALPWSLFVPLSFLNAYQWPVEAEKIVRGFLTSQAETTTEKPLPSLGLWFELDSEDSIAPYHDGEIVYFETSAEMDMIGAIPRHLDQSIVVQHGKLLFRYSGEQMETKLQDNYEVDVQDSLFVLDSDDAQLYVEVFDTQFQTVINPKLILPNNDRERPGSSQPFLESIIMESEEDVPINRALRVRDSLPRGIYNLSFRFPQNQGSPLKLFVRLDDKTIYSELFDQVSGINSRLIINDRNLQDIYIADEREGKFLLGTINLQDKTNRNLRLSIDEEYIDGSHKIGNYNLRILF